MLKTDRIKYTEKKVEAYSTEDLNALFAAANREENDLFQFLLCTGVREQEAVHAKWADVDFHRKKFHVARSAISWPLLPKTTKNAPFQFRNRWLICFRLGENG
jgi:integrase